MGWIVLDQSIQIKASVNVSADWLLIAELVLRGSLLSADAQLRAEVTGQS